MVGTDARAARDGVLYFVNAHKCAKKGSITLVKQNGTANKKKESLNGLFNDETLLRLADNGGPTVRDSAAAVSVSRMSESN